MQTTKNSVFSNISAVIDKAVEMYKGQCDINILIDPEIAEKVVEILESKHKFTHNIECAAMLQCDIITAIVKETPIMVGLIHMADKNEIITEWLHKEYTADAFMEGFYFVQNKYNSCLLIINPYDYTLFETEI